MKDAERCGLTVVRVQCEFGTLVQVVKYSISTNPEKGLGGHLQPPGLTTHFFCGVMSDLVICKCRLWSYMTLIVLTETRCR